MSIESHEELVGLRAAGRVVALALAEMQRHVAPGVTTAELGEIGGRVIAANGAHPAPKRVYRFPGDVCISINDEVVHGIPSERVLAPGDLVTLDVTVEKDGFFADAAVTLPVGGVSEAARALIACAERAFYKAMVVARAGNRLGHIGRAVEQEARRSGLSVVRGLAGHGIGRTIHEAPDVPNYYDPRTNQRLTDGLVLAVEPMLAAGSGHVVERSDGWTVATADGSLSAHYEHTVVITKGKPILLTALSN